jgi:hypothetical protein
MRRFLLFAGAALAAVAFSPGPEFGLALVVIALTVAADVLAVPWLKSNFFSLTSNYADHLTGHGHVHLQADGLGAGGRHGPPRSIIVLMVLVIWALILSVWTLIGRAVVKNLAVSAGHALARTNTAVQPLPS